MEYVDRGVEYEQPIERHAVEVFECTVPLHRDSVDDKRVEEMATASASVSGLALPQEHWPEVSDDAKAELQRQQEQLDRLRQLLEHKRDQRGNGDYDQLEKTQSEDISVCYQWMTFSSVNNTLL